MISRILTRTFILLSLIAICAAPSHASEIPWQPDWNSAVAQSLRGNRLILVDFFTDWCGWCKKMDTDVYPAPAVQRAMAGFVPLRLDAEREGSALAKRYKVHGYPTIMVLDGSGNVVEQFAGYMEPADFAAWLGDVAHDHAAASRERPAAQMSRIHETTKFIPIDQGDPAEPEPTMALAQKYLDHGDVAAAGRTVARVAHGGGVVPAAFYSKLGDAALQSKKADSAWGWYQIAIKAAKTSDDSAYACLQCARAELALGSAARATARLKSLIEDAETPAKIKLQARALLDAADDPSARATMRTRR